jgi:hypothetical protein
MKKFFLIFLVIFLSVTLVYSQNENNDNSGQTNEIEQPKQIKSVVAINIGYLITAIKNGTGFGMGIWYERYLNRFTSLVIDTGGLFFSKNDMGYGKYDLTLHGRIYPLGTSPLNFFIGGSGGYSFLDIGYNNDHSKSHLTTVTPEIGYKFLFGSHIMLEIYLGYAFKFGTINYPKRLTGKDSLDNGITYGILGGWVF